jgi:anti-sigma B factor antagonist
MPEPVDQPLRIDQRPGERILALDGELDMADTEALVEAAAAFAAEPGDLTLDLSRLTFVDSSGLLALLRIADRLSDGRLILLRPTEQVQKVFDMVELAAVSPRIVIAD